MRDLFVVCKPIHTRKTARALNTSTRGIEREHVINLNGETAMRALVVVMAICCCIWTNAYAQTQQSTVAGGPLYGGPSQAYVACYSLNAGFPTEDINRGIFDIVLRQRGHFPCWVATLSRVGRRVGLTDARADTLVDARTGKNGRHR
jgi:hypothetical protein